MISGSTSVLQRCIMSVVMAHLSSVLVHPKHQLCCGEVALEPFMSLLQEQIVVFLISKGNFTPLHEDLLCLKLISQ